jgi:hypothetical protein
LTIRFLGTPIDQFDRLCKEEEKVTITISCFSTEEYNDGTPSELVLTFQESWQILSSKDIFQFDYEDMKMLTENTKKSLR